jgi:hypothetical protein
VTEAGSGSTQHDDRTGAGEAIDRPAPSRADAVGPSRDRITPLLLGLCALGLLPLWIMYEVMDPGLRSPSPYLPLLAAGCVAVAALIERGRPGAQTLRWSGAAALANGGILLALCIQGQANRELSSLLIPSLLLVGAGARLTSAARPAADAPEDSLDQRAAADRPTATTQPMAPRRSWPIDWGTLVLLAFATYAWGQRGDTIPSPILGAIRGHQELLIVLGLVVVVRPIPWPVRQLACGFLAAMGIATILGALTSPRPTEPYGLSWDEYVLAGAFLAGAGAWAIRDSRVSRGPYAWLKFISLVDLGWMPLVMFGLAMSGAIGSGCETAACEARSTLTWEESQFLWPLCLAVAILLPIAFLAPGPVRQAAAVGYGIVAAILVLTGSSEHRETWLALALALSAGAAMVYVDARPPSAAVGIGERTTDPPSVPAPVTQADP